MTLYLYISCALQCESEEVTDPSPERCHGLSLLKKMIIVVIMKEKTQILA